MFKDLVERNIRRQVAVARRAVVVVWRPVADRARRAAHLRVQRHAPFHRRLIDERLVGRTSRATCRRREVCFVGFGVIAADQGNNLAALSVDRYHRALHIQDL